MIKRAIIHVENTDKILEFATFLTSNNWTILTANKTEELLKKHKIPVTKELALVESTVYISDSSRLIKQILLSRYDIDESYSQDNDDNNIYIICMNITPKLKISESSNPFESSICPQDFFISTILRNSFSNYENILILTDPDDYEEAMIQLKTGDISKKFRAYLAAKALNLISAYDGGISSSILQNPQLKNPYMNYLMYPFKKSFPLSKGANKHQTAYLYKAPNNYSTINSFHKIQGKELSFSETNDVLYAWEQISSLYIILKNQFKVKCTNVDGYDFTTQFTPLTGTVCTIAVKFNSILGAAISTNVLDSFKQTCSYDIENTKMAILACSAVIDSSVATEIIKHDFSAVVAPSFTNDAKQILSLNKNIRLIPSGQVQPFEMDGKLVNGGIILQTKDNELFNSWKVKTKNRPSQIISDEMAFGMLLAMRAHSYSAILLKNNSIVGISQACTSTKKAIDGVLYEAKMYIQRNNKQEENEHFDSIADVLICDAEICFSETVKELINCGLKAIIQTGGTSSDNEFINYCDEHGTVMVFTEMTHISF